MGRHFAESEFKVGDRVRVLNNVTLGGCKIEKYPVGALLTIERTCFDGRGDEAYLFDGHFQYLRGDQIEPAPLFAVGEAVKSEGGYRVNHKDTWYGVCHGSDDDLVHATTLAIQAGRYYKTRDGRKVGPMEEGCGYSGQMMFDKSKAITGYGWNKDGSYLPSRSKLDLIAEWPVEVAPVVAPATTTAKFKVGDRVKTRKGLGAIKKVGDDGWPLVDHDTRVAGGHNQDGCKDGHGYWYNPHDVALIQAASPTTIASIGDIVRKPSGTAVVMLIEDGQPKPSTEPFVHSDKDAAATEASRLASIHKGQEFGVYTCVDVKKVEKPAYEHEWQRLAAKGERVAACKALRALAGVSLLSAVKAVDAVKDAA